MNRKTRLSRAKNVASCISIKVSMLCSPFPASAKDLVVNLTHTIGDTEPICVETVMPVAKQRHFCSNLGFLFLCLRALALNINFHCDIFFC